MKKGVSILLLGIIFLFLPLLSAEGCNLDISLINQDPYPAVPGDYVKIVFQVEGVSNPECGQIEFELLEQYPLIFDPEQSTKIIIDSGFYNKDFSSSLIAPYKVRIDPNALDGDNPIEIRYEYGNSVDLYVTEEFNINIEDTIVDFEVHVKNYDHSNHEITFEILNTGSSDIEALTIEVPKQNSIEIKGPKTNIIGNLDSNDYTTATFEATPIAGEINLILYYTDSINERRTVEKSLIFEPEYFEGRNGNEKKTSTWFYLFILLIIFLIGKYYWKKRKVKLKHKKH